MPKPAGNVPVYACRPRNGIGALLAGSGIPPERLQEPARLISHHLL